MTTRKCTVYSMWSWNTVHMHIHICMFRYVQMHIYTYIYDLVKRSKIFLEEMCIFINVYILIYLYIKFFFWRTALGVFPRPVDIISDWLINSVEQNSHLIMLVEYVNNLHKLCTETLQSIQYTKAFSSWKWKCFL